MSVIPQISRFCDENNFSFDQGTGTVDVGQTFPGTHDSACKLYLYNVYMFHVYIMFYIQADRTATLEESGFWERPAVKDFLHVNPQWQDRDIFIAWEWDEANLTKMRNAADKQAKLTSTFIESPINIGR